MAGMKSYILITAIKKYLNQNDIIKLLFIALLVLAIAVRISFAISLEHPGHGDTSYYLTLAQNIADGRGFVIDYIWHFFYPQENLTHPANDFWAPLTSVIISLFLAVFGKSLFIALIPSIIFGMLIAFITYRISVLYFQSKLLAYWAAGLSLFTPHLFIFSFLTDTVIYYAAFISLGLYFIIKGQVNPRYFYLSAILAGLANLTRQDGIFLYIIVLAAVIILNISAKQKLKTLLICTAIYILILSPYMISNLYYFDSIYAASSYKLAFLQTYEDHYSYAKELSLSTYLAWGLSNILKLKSQIVIPNIITTLRLFGTILFPFLAIGIINMIYYLLKSNIRKNVFPPVLYFIMLFLFYTLIVNFSAYGGGYHRSIQALMPFFIVFSIDGLARLIKSKSLLYPLMTIISLAMVILSISEGNKLLAYCHKQNLSLTNLKTTIEHIHKSNEEIVLRTRHPWESHNSTGLRAIQIPNDDLETIYKVALNYKANYLLLPAPRKALEDIYDGRKVDSRFKYLSDIADSDLKIFKIIL